VVNGPESGARGSTSATRCHKGRYTRQLRRPARRKKQPRWLVCQRGELAGDIGGRPSSNRLQHCRPVSALQGAEAHRTVAGRRSRIPHVRRCPSREPCRAIQLGRARAGQGRAQPLSCGMAGGGRTVQVLTFPTRHSNSHAGVQGLFSSVLCQRDITTVSPMGRLDRARDKDQSRLDIVTAL